MFYFFWELNNDEDVADQSQATIFQISPNSQD
jgi:hypothetical protein